MHKILRKELCEELKKNRTSKFKIEPMLLNCQSQKLPKVVGHNFNVENMWKEQTSRKTSFICTLITVPALLLVYIAEDQVKQLDVKRRITAQFIMNGVTLPASKVHKKTEFLLRFSLWCTLCFVFFCSDIPLDKRRNCNEFDR